MYKVYVYTLAMESKSTSAKKGKESDSSNDGMYLATYLYMHIRAETVSASLTPVTHWSQLPIDQECNSDQTGLDLHLTQMWRSLSTVEALTEA